jgi:hypothetical protein
MVSQVQVYIYIKVMSPIHDFFLNRTRGAIEAFECRKASPAACRDAWDIAAAGHTLRYASNQRCKETSFPSIKLSLPPINISFVVISFPLPSARTLYPISTPMPHDQASLSANTPPSPSSCILKTKPTAHQTQALLSTISRASLWDCGIHLHVSLLYIFPLPFSSSLLTLAPSKHNTSLLASPLVTPPLYS